MPASEVPPVVKLFSKADCQLCDELQMSLSAWQKESPHTLQMVDVTDSENGRWLEKYWADIPVVHLNGQFVAKWRLSQDAFATLVRRSARGEDVTQPGEPDARNYKDIK